MKRCILALALVLGLAAVAEAHEPVFVQSSVFVQRAPVVFAQPFFVRQAVVVQASPVIVRQRAVVIQRAPVVVRTGVFRTRVIVR